MRGDLGSRYARVETLGPLRQDVPGSGQRRAGIGAGRCAVIGRAFDAEANRPLAEPKMNHHIGLQARVKTRRERGHSLPFGGQDVGVELAAGPLRRAQRLGKRGGRIFRGAGKGAEARDEDARPSHDLDLQGTPAGGK